MNKESLDRMKRLIEEKKTGQSNSDKKRPQKSIGSTHKAYKNLKQGGALDK